MRHIVIIGNGIAGITAARELRKGGDDRITVISSETDHHFSRTALMYIYMGHMTYAHTKPYEDWFWSKNRIDLVRAHVTGIDFDNKQLTTKPTDGAELTRSYDVLILAVGSSPNRPGVLQTNLRGVQGLYGMPDLEQMEALTDAKESGTLVSRAVVIGGGLIGIELCEMLLSREIPVSFLVRESGFWRSVLPVEESAMITRHIREHHVDLQLETEVTDIHDDGNGRIGSVTTSTGQRINCQFAGVSVGVSANIGWLQGTSLETDRGILVDTYLATNVPDVYAIGDCVQHRTPPPGRKPTEQIWYTGRIMGETLAQTLLGKKTPYQPGVFFNSAKFFDIEYQTYGDVPANLPDNGTIQSLYWEHPNGQKAIRINYTTANGAVMGVNAFGIRQRQDVWTRWITEKRPIHYVLEHLAQANFDPEFFRQHEADVLAVYNAQHPDAPLRLRAKKGLFALFGK
ncbi:NAD(P)/FAD-dependent oxidoreductase [Fibrella forsythiae]|uniref:FAD-dependent oxidoreductase n=1 Tax=Fibrella forsythiae TaxID=2817061 RepID=A0ABS3JCH8_9BACT|nr:NAD(P)/FAD-dependent oxidoreductase [Fibrella forsythiae]MBO0947692.1 FAD-dependent oxidoreductase [Fibrella forsythiae]